MPDAPRTHLPTPPRPQDEAEEARAPDVAPWMPLDLEDVTPTGQDPGPGGGTGEPPARDAKARPEPPLPGKPTPPLDLPLPVLVLTEQARRVSDEERPEIASRLNALLKQMARDGGDRQVADTFHRLLEGGKLEGLVDTEGRSCRAVAVESLLALGFPYALEVRPEDLEHLRTAGRGRRGARIDPMAPLAVMGVGLAAQGFLEWMEPGKADSLVTFQVGLSLLFSIALWLAPPGTAVYRVALGLLAVLSGFALVLSLVPAAPVGVWAGLAGLVAVLLAALRES